MSEKCATNPTVTELFQSLLNLCCTISNRIKKNVVKKVVKKFSDVSKSCQKVVKKLSKVVKKVVKKLSKLQKFDPTFVPPEPSWSLVDQGPTVAGQISKIAKNPKTDCKCSKIAEIKTFRTHWRTFCFPRPDATKSHLVIRK
jgi:IS4 transposase